MTHRNRKSNKSKVWGEAQRGRHGLRLSIDLYIPSPPTLWNVNRVKRRTEVYSFIKPQLESLKHAIRSNNGIVKVYIDV